METKENQKKTKIKGAHYDPEMDKYDSVILFPEKLARAKENIRNSNLLEFLDKMNKKEEANK